jgi:hypothetical protein
MIKRFLMLCLLTGAVSYSLGTDVNAETKSKSVKATFIELDGIDKTQWIVNVPLPDCGSGLPDSKYTIQLFKAGDNLKIVCKEKQ